MCRDCRDLLVDPWWQESLSHLGLTPTSGQIIDDRVNTVPYPISSYLLLTKFTVATWLPATDKAGIAMFLVHFSPISSHFDQRTDLFATEFSS